MTEELKMPDEIWAYGNCLPDDPGTYGENPHYGGTRYIRADLAPAVDDAKPEYDDLYFETYDPAREAKPEDRGAENTSGERENWFAQVFDALDRLHVNAEYNGCLRDKRAVRQALAAPDHTELLGEALAALELSKIYTRNMRISKTKRVIIDSTIAKINALLGGK